MCNLQRLAGTHQMWMLLSFTGRWDEKFLRKLVENKMPAQQTTQDQKKKTVQAVEARSALRYAHRLANWGKRQKLSPWQQDLVKRLRSGELLKEANRLTKESGHGRLYGESGDVLDIGGSTGGKLRTLCYDWTPPTSVELNRF